MCYVIFLLKNKYNSYSFIWDYKIFIYKNYKKILIKTKILIEYAIAQEEEKDNAMALNPEFRFGPLTAQIRLTF